MTEQRYRAVLEVRAGVPVTEVAERFGVSRQAVHRWRRWYEDEGLDGLADRSHRPRAHPAQISPEVEAAICEMRRAHPRWGQRRIEFELGRTGSPGPIPSVSTIYRVLVRHGLVDAVPRRRRRQDYKRWQRDRPMELWQLDIVDGVRLADGTDTKIVTGVDDHSRFCVIATVVRRATGRAVCAAFADALREYGIPDEVLTDNGKQFTGRFTRPRPAEVMFERICRENGIIARNTKPRTPTTTGKIERFHQTLQGDLLDHVEVWPDIETAQAAVDAFRAEYNTNRPHQALDMAFPAEVFIPRPADERLPPRLPTTLTPAAPVPCPAPPGVAAPEPALPAPPVVSANGGEPVTLAVEVSRTVPGSGNLTVGGQQFWLGPDRPAPRSRCGPTPPWCTYWSTASGSRPCRRGSPPRSCGSYSPTAAAPPAPHPSAPMTNSRARRSRSTGWSTPPARSPSPAGNTRSGTTSPAAVSPSGSTAAYSSSSTTVCCCAACPTGSPRPTWPGCATPAPPDHHPHQRPSRCACSDASPAAAPSPSPGNASTSASSTPDAP
jgi:transposase InsO family protein